MDSNQFIKLRFYAELNDFLPKELRAISFSHRLIAHATIKDTIEALGVPHTEIDLILVNGHSVNFNYQPHAMDDISIYPVFELLDIGDVTHLRSQPLRQPIFILDVHLGKLTRFLRMLGFDCYYQRYLSDEEIIELSLAEKRIILTRDINLLKTKKVTHGYWVRNTNSKKQLLEIIRYFDLKKQIQPFKRCMECNGIIAAIDKAAIQKQLPPKAKQYYQQFSHCKDCKKIFWEGSHYVKMQQFIAEIIHSTHSGDTPL